MPFYYVYADFGPGHATSKDLIEWSDYDLSDQGMKDLFKSNFGDYDYPKGKVVKIKSLTLEEKNKEVSKYYRQFQQAQKMLAVLLDVPIRRTDRPRIAKNKAYCEKVRMMKSC